MTTLITPLPTPPTRQDSSNFNDRADDFLGALPLFQQEANGLAIDVQASAYDVEIARQAVVSTANVTKWVSDTTYAQGTAVWSPINGVTYRKMTSSTGGTTDPSLDSVNYKSITNSSGVIYNPAGTSAVETTVQNKLREFVSVKDFGAVGNGAVDDGNAIQAAIDYTASVGGGVVFFPPGTYYKSAVTPAVTPKSNVTLRGSGMGATVLKHDDTIGTNRYIGSVSVEGACSNFSIESLTFEGSWTTSLNSNGRQIAELWYITNLRIVGVQVKNSRAMGLTGRFCDGVLIEGCDISRTNADGVAFWDCSDVRVIGNNFYDCDDDCISLHTNDSTASPLRNRVEVIGNTISTSQGIKVLGAKNAIIAYNSLSRCYAYGIYVDYDTTFNQGNTPNHSVQIVGNNINDVFKRVQGGNAEQYYVRIGGGQQNAGGGVAAPGRNYTGTGNIVDLFGSTVGNFQAQNTDSTSVASPGGYFWRIEGNILARTLPAVSSVADWGFGSLWAGNQSAGEYTGAVTEADLNTNGIVVEPYIKRAIIQSNIIATTGDRAIFFNVGATPASHLFNDFTIRCNKITDFKSYGIFWPGGALSQQDIRISENDFDGDPRFVSTNRGSNGTWLAGTLPSGVYAAFLSGADISNNQYSNLAIPNTIGGSAVCNIHNNLYRCDPVAVGFSTSNKGIGTVSRAGTQSRYAIVDSDPTSATFCGLLNQTLYDSSNIPTSGKYVSGHVVRCVNPSVGGSAGSQYVLTGWIRITTGTEHVLNTDWREMRALTGT